MGLPKNFGGKTNEVVLMLAHTKPEIEVYWFVDGKFS